MCFAVVCCAVVVLGCWLVGGSGLHAALAHVIRLGSETDFAPGSPLRAFVIDNADVVREAIVSSPPPPAAAGAMFEDAGTAVVERLLLFLV